VAKGGNMREEQALKRENHAVILRIPGGWAREIDGWIVKGGTPHLPAEPVAEFAAGKVGARS
jgi:hypothetical protein